MECSHDYKATVAAFESFPRDELFQAPVEALRAEVVAAARAEEAQRVTLTVRRDAASRNITVMVAMPGDRMSTELRIRLQELLAKRYNAESSEYHLALVEGAAAQLFFLLHVPAGEAPEVPLEQLEQEVARLARTWDDRLAEELVTRFGDADGRRLAALYAARLPDYYKTATPPDLALADIALLERVAAGEAFAVGLQNEHAAHTQVGARPLTRVTVATPGGKIPLGELLPVLEALGLTVMEEVPTRLDGGDDGAYLHDFGVLVDDAQLDCDRDGDRLAEAITAIWGGRCESDTLNALVVRAGLRAEDVVILRAYRRYRRIVAPTFTAAYQNDVLCLHPQTASLLVELFRARFCDPDGEARAEELRERLDEQLTAVGSLDEDRILRGFAALMDATVRTNAALGRPYLSFKLRSADVPQMPAPAPLFEIFVYHPLVEGIHLRGGHVARGGIRWSDRREDYRSEVLGLMKAQMVKNAVIVPVGAKGGFVLRAPPSDRDLLRAEVQLRYSTFIRGLLDVTDNIVGGEVVHPAGVRALDEDDPYLVVAADKGTASFSDIANGIAEDYGFWLGDAFASGGSAGYDHKTMGITARGAWESVVRHFRELGIDPDRDDFTCVGIGDMSGDVFGNGMLLSEHLRLVAAFDHRHVFLDPDPDPARSFAERRRLFGLARSSWADYDPALISEGGGVYPRTLKSVPVSEPVRRALGLPADVTSLDPTALISAALKAPVDLLWNGGIGTYVKAETETNADAGDKANDGLRVNGAQLRARCVGEGGNLGLTQLGRIEYATCGGKINTDFIDNSAGVDTSDHEVNIKIMLAPHVADGSLTTEGRNALLASMTDDVAGLVLAHNVSQNLALANAEAQAPSMARVHGAWIERLEDQGLIDRAIEFLPEEEALDARLAKNRGLTSPELAVLLAYTKIVLSDEVGRSDLPDETDLRDRLVTYFPPALRGAYAEQMRHHRLHREIVTTVVVNTFVDTAGITCFHRLSTETGASAPDLIRAHIAAREIFGAAGLETAIAELDHAVAAETQTRMRLAVRTLVERAARWLVNERPRPLDISATVAELGPGVRTVVGVLPETLGRREADGVASRAAELRTAGVPDVLAGVVAASPAAFSALSSVTTARREDLDPTLVAAVHFELAQRLGLDRLMTRVTALPREDRWSTMARAALRDDLHTVHARLTAQVVAGGAAPRPGRAADPARTADQLVDAWERGTPAFGGARSTLRSVLTGSTDLAKASVALRVVRGLSGD
jgi:glutamate dehydrogenase